MATETIQIGWNNGYYLISSPSSMTQGDTLNVVPPSIGCTINFSPPLPLSGTTSPTYPNYTLQGLMVAFTMPTQPTDYDFTFSVDGRDGKSGIPDHTIPIKKT